MSETLMVSVSMATKLGLGKALILNQLIRYSTLPFANTKTEQECIWLNVNLEEWHETLFPFFKIAVFKRHLTQLENSGYITRNADWITVNHFRLGLEKPKVKKKKVAGQVDMFGQVAKPKKRKSTPIQEINIMLRKAVKATQAVGFARYMSLAQDIEKMGCTANFIDEMYIQEDGWWYSEDWRGANAQPPTEASIRQTIGLAIEWDDGKQDKAVWSPLG
jgi:hypothetical protein